MDPLPLLEWECTPRSVRRRELSDMDETIQAQIARLASDVKHVQTDVAEIKVDLRRVDDKLAAMNERIVSVDSRLYKEIAAVRNDISSMKVWALTLYFAQAGSLLFVMAKGFKWF
jgi:hypothetical protein